MRDLDPDWSSSVEAAPSRQAGPGLSPPQSRPESMQRRAESEEEPTKSGEEGSRECLPSGVDPAAFTGKGMG